MWNLKRRNKSSNRGLMIAIAVTAVTLFLSRASLRDLVRYMRIRAM